MNETGRRRYTGSGGFCTASSGTAVHFAWNQITTEYDHVAQVFACYIVQTDETNIPVLCLRINSRNRRF
jgi:hypothetical protein